MLPTDKGLFFCPYCRPKNLTVDYAGIGNGEFDYTCMACNVKIHSEIIRKQKYQRGIKE